LEVGFLCGETSQFPCPEKDAREHGAVETAGVGITQRRVIGSEKMKAVGEKILGAMGEAIVGFAGDDAGVEEVGEVAVEGDLSQADDDADARERLNFIGQMDGAVANLLRDRFVAGRGAANDRGDPGVAEFQSVVAMSARWLAGEAQFMQHGIHEVAGAIASERTARSIGSMRARSKPKDENAGAGIAKS
jgi:hypothetical protein